MGDLNADPGVIPCLAEGIAAGRFVDLALAHSLSAGKELDATCRIKLDDCAETRRDCGCLPECVGCLVCLSRL